MSSRATQSSLLEQRIAENTASQSIDLTTWIFERVAVCAGGKVLELCCGTGGQSLKMLDLLGESGQLVAMDISPEALSTLESRAGAARRARLKTIATNIDEFTTALRSAGFQPGTFDLVFCAYGLYYSSDPERVLAEAIAWLKPGGRIAIAGPFGPNNGPLFDVIRAAGVRLSEPVTFSSERFMTQTVVPWGARHFEGMAVHTIVNPVRWPSVDRVLNYWENTTFYDAEKRAAVEQLLHQHFNSNKEFVNEKWVMLIEMANARP